MFVGMGEVIVGLGAVGSAGLTSVGDRSEQAARRSSSRSPARGLILLIFILR